jgi:hypothetical protein
MASLSLMTVFLVAAMASGEVGALNHVPIEGEQCSAAMLRGVYIFADSGEQSTTEGGARVETHNAEAGIEIHDGYGHARGKYTYSDEGEISRGTYTAVYVVNPDCSGTAVVTDADGSVSNYDIYLMPGGEEYAYISTDDGNVDSGWARRRGGSRGMLPSR